MPSDDKKIEDLPVMESAASLVSSNTDSSVNDSVSNLHNESSLSNLSIANASYESVRSLCSQKLAQAPGSNINLLNTTGMPTLSAQDNSLLQPAHPSSTNYNLNQVKFFYFKTNKLYFKILDAFGRSKWFSIYINRL